MTKQSKKSLAETLKGDTDMKETVLLEGTTVGEIFRKAREQRGLTLTMVAKELMIRKFYLSALEEGRYHELPSSVYAVGFVKSYSEFLGLETEKLIERFRRERGGANQRTELIFPEMVTESKLPGRGVIFGGIAAAVAVLFIGASILGEDKQNELTTVPEPVASQNEVLPGTSEPVLPAVTADTAITSDTSSADEAAPPEDNTPVATQDAQPSAASTASLTVEGNVSAQQLPAAEQTPAADAAATSIQPVTDAAQPETQTTSATVTEQQPSAVQPAVTEPAVTDKPDAKTETLNSGTRVKSRITVAAADEAWVEIRDKNGVLLLSRVLQPGQRYDVPDEKGITMMTGNAGGIFLIVDGKELPPIGKPSMVRRNLRLDADLIR